MSHEEVQPAPRRGRPVLEGLLSLGLGLLLALLARRPQDLAETVPGDARDPVLQSWVLAWPAHALRTGQHLWDGNVFAPLPGSFAFTDAMLGYAPLGLVGSGPAAALVRYNVVLLLTTALAFAGTWVLVRQLGLGRTAALLAATAFAFNPWRVSQLNHLQVLSSGAIPLALAMLARGHGLRLRAGGPVRPGWALAGWAVATWHVSLGFGLGMQLAYVLVLCTAVAAVRALHAARRGAGLPSRRLLAADGAGIVLLLAVTAVLALPYLENVEDHPNARRSVAEVASYSPTASSLLTAPADSWFWGDYTEGRREGVAALNERALFPGFVVTVLAVVGLLPGAWSWRRRAVLAGTVVVVTVCALGTNGPGDGRWTYLLLYEHLPGWQGVRTPGRLVTTSWLALALLAANGAAVLRQAVRGVTREPGAAVAVALGLSALAFVEGLDRARSTPVPPPPSVRLADLPQPVMVLPSEDLFDQNVMRWSTDGFPRVVNGISGFTPREQGELRDAASRLPDPRALARLRESGVASLLLLPEHLRGSRYARIDLLGLAALPGVQLQQHPDAVVVLIDTAAAD